MISTLQLLRNVGQFDSVATGAQLPQGKLALIYAENGRGKTTVASILRSLSSGNPRPISERRRLGAQYPPHIAISTSAGATFVFQNDAWSRTLSEVAVFDDHFVATNVCSGLAIEAEHRQNLHELILGSQGVSLSVQLQTCIGRVEQHNRDLRDIEKYIPSTARGTLDVDAFCTLEADDDIDAKLQNAERALAAARSADAVLRQADFVPIQLPAFDISAIDTLLRRGLPELDADAAARVQAHLVSLGEGGESWVRDGMPRVKGNACPFCTQEMSTSPVLTHYRAYFSEGYATLVRTVADQIVDLQKMHFGDVPAAFERSVRICSQRREFWRSFMTVPHFEIDTAAVLRVWNSAREAVLSCLNEKKSAPLEASALPSIARQAIAAYDKAVGAVRSASSALEEVNSTIALVKEQAATANVTALEGDLRRLKIIKQRFEPNIDQICRDYLAEKVAKTGTESARDQARRALESYRQSIFPAYETAINEYLRRFYAGFRLSSVNSINTRGGSTCSYAVVINNVPISVTAAGSGPSFRNTLSAGDRNTLALAFFFASLDRVPNLSQKIVVIDDPMTSLDEHRSLATIQEMRRLLGRIDQMIVLSHSKPFLCEIWEGADTALRSAIRIVRDGSSSTLSGWNVRHDCISEHDKRHEKIRDYLRNGAAANEREVASALRPVLENFMRVAYPGAFPPGALLGPFIGRCEQSVGTSGTILKKSDIDELRDLLDYANRFHHDSNAAWETEAINDQQLVQFCERTLRFASRG